MTGQVGEVEQSRKIFFWIFIKETVVEVSRVGRMLVTPSILQVCNMGKVCGRKISAIAFVEENRARCSRRTTTWGSRTL